MNNAIFGIRKVYLDRLVVVRKHVSTKIKFITNKPFSNELAKIKIMKLGKRGR